MKSKLLIGSMLIYFSSGIIFDHHFWIGLPILLMGSLLVGYVSSKIDN